MLEPFANPASASLLAAILAVGVAGLGVPMPETPFLLAAGVLTQQGAINPWMMGVVVLLVAFGGDVGLFLISRRYGEALLRTRLIRWIATPERRERVSELFATRGVHAVWVGRQVAGLRTVATILAGVERMPIRSFVLADAFGSVFSTLPAYILGYVFAANIDVVERALSRFETVLIVVVVAAIGAWWWRSRRRAQPVGE